MAGAAHRQAPPRVALVRLGCRVNQADADAAVEALAARAPTEGTGGPAKSSPPDAVVVSTCAVTADAEAAAFQAVRRAVRENPGVPVVVCGCLGALKRRELEDIEGVVAVIGPGEPGAVADAVAAALSAGLPGAESSRVSTGRNGGAWSGWTAPAALGARARPVLKIQDGCDQRCAYCVVPFARGPSRCMPWDDVVARVSALGLVTDEVVLAGVHLGAFDGGAGAPGATARSRLASLLDTIAERRLVRRVRLSSIDPLEFPLDALAGRSADVLCAAFHLPLQSGSDRVLRAMRRPYDAEGAAAVVRAIAARSPAAAVTADVMAGFPGETEDDHLATLALVRSVPLAALHVFTFSPREGTAAAAMPEQVPRAVARRRAAELRAASGEAWRAFVDRHAGREVEVVAERVEDGEASGTTREGILARWRVGDGEPPRRGRALWVRALSREGDTLRCVRA